MILQALHEYYQRKMADPDPARRLPASGLEEKEIPFILELTRDGWLVAIKDTRTGVGRVKVATRFLVPKAVKKASGIAANLLWDNAEYVLAVPDPKKLAQTPQQERYLTRLRDMQSAFKSRLDELPADVRTDEGIAAVQAFLAANPATAVRRHSAWAEIEASNPIVSFRLAGEVDLICARPAIATATATAGATASENTDVGNAVCLITGELCVPERLHAAVKGVWNAQPSGANIVSFNLDAFNSFGKKQGSNAPVSANAAFAYITALNRLLAKGSRQRLQVGDASTVFWAQKSDDSDVEDWFISIFGEVDDPDRTEEIRSLFTSVTSGRFAGARGDNRFYVLGLAPNAARIAVRFWHAASIAEIGRRIRDWFEDLSVVRGPGDPEFPTLFRLLATTAVLGKAENIAPNLGGDLMRAILAGTPLPAPLLHAVVQRCRAEQSKKTETGTPVLNVSYHRAALLKACLNRLIQRGQLEGKRITVALDPTNTEPAYLAGRLFATYERIQSDATERELNRTIRDTYFGAAMSNPATVFSRLVVLNQHHLRDLKRSKPSLHVVRDRLVGEIWDKLHSDRHLPPTLPLAERARFALGYYHQRQAFFTKAQPDSTAKGGN